MKRDKFTIHSKQGNLDALNIPNLKEIPNKGDLTSERLNASSTMIHADLDKASVAKKLKELKLKGINAEILASPTNIMRTESGEIVNFDFSSGEAFDPNSKIIGQIKGCEVTSASMNPARVRTMTRFGRNVESLNKKALKFGPNQSNVQFSIPEKYAQASVFAAEIRFLVSNFSESRINLLEGQSPGFSISIRKLNNQHYLHFSVATNDGWKSFSHYSTPITLNQWHEAAFIFKAGELSVILNSHLISRGLVPAKKLRSVGNNIIFLGTWVDGRRNQFIGKVQFVKLWSKIPAHIMNSYNINLQLDYNQACGYKLTTKAPIKSGSFIFPGEASPVQIKYRFIDGMVVLDGGTILGKESELKTEVQRATGNASPDVDQPHDAVRSVQQALLAVSSRNKLWDNGILYYQTENLSTLLINRLDETIKILERETNIRFVPASAANKDVVVYRINKDANAHGESYSTGLGKVGGKQYIALHKLASVSTIIHETFHALGIMHEQCRNDRDSYIQIHWDNLDFETADEKNVRYQFEKLKESIDLGSSDYNSVMHYHPNSYGRKDPDLGQLTTISSISGVPIQRVGLDPFMSSTDIAQINKLYPVKTVFDDGQTWGSSAYTTGIAFGDINGDGADELLVARKHGSGNRFFFYNSEKNDKPYRELTAGGSGWGGGAYATCIAAGDVDGDGKDEVIIGRKSDTNMRFEIRKYDPSKPEKTIQLFEGGNTWGKGAYTTGVAISKDRNGRVLIAVCRKSGGNARFFIFGGARDNYRLLYEGGKDWGGSNYATSIAFGDVDGDGYLEVGVTRYAKSGPRFMIFKAVNGDYRNFQTLHSGGSDWGGSFYATAIAFGDVDGDGKQEAGVTRKASSNERFFIYGNSAQNFRLRYSGGNKWGSSYYANSIAMADVDNDGRAEILVGRNADSNARYFLYDDGLKDYQLLADGGKDWGKDYYTSAVALGNPRGGSHRPFLAIGRKASSNQRFSVFNFEP
ncbi:MAG: M12 family metallopeptidase [Lentimicrobiaceae bacterium]|nr:M12 family metallopeptidase [Lentimicrobiaceae bacterium]